MKFPQKIYDLNNPSNFKIANNSSEYSHHINHYDVNNIDWDVEPYLNYNIKSAKEFFDSLRKHQHEAMWKLISVDIGQCILPTSTGKTMVQQAIILHDAIEKQKENKFGIYLIGNHRLALSKQLIDGISNLFESCELPFNILSINSDNLKNDDLGLPINKYDVISTTTKEEIDRAFMKARNQKRHLLIVSTYHSIDRLTNEYSVYGNSKHITGIDKQIDIATFDEAHEIVKETFGNSVFELAPQIKRKYFFTATPKWLNESEGMRDYSKYGYPVYGKSPKEMIDAGEMLCPQLHLLECKNELATSENMKIKTTIDSFVYHEKYLKQCSANPNAINPKLLISCESIDQMRDIHNNSSFQEYCSTNNIRVFAFSSVFEKLENCYDFQNYSRDYVYNSLKNLKDDEKAIIFHYDILSEGIDLPSITGVALFRSMSLSKMLQTIGRCLRLNKDDRTNLYSGKIAVGDIDKLTKPYGWVIIPKFFNPDMNAMKTVIETIYNEYKIPNENINILDTSSGTHPPIVEDVSIQQEVLLLDANYDIAHLVKAIQQKMRKDVYDNFDIEDFLYF